MTLWHVASGQAVAPFRIPRSDIESIAFSPDGRTIAVGESDPQVTLWAITSGQLIATFYGHSGTVNAVAFSPDGATLATGSDDHTVRLWDVASGQEIATLQGHTDAVGAVAFSPGGRLLATGSSDGTVKLWDVATRQQMATLTGHASGIFAVAFSPDGSTIASGSASPDPVIMLWDIVSNQEIAAFRGHESTVWSVAFSPDGAQLASGSADATVKLWDVPPRPSAAVFHLPAGLSLIHVPVQVSGLVSAADLYDSLGGAQDVSLVVATDDDGTFLAYSSSVERGSRADFALNPYSAVFVVMKRPKVVQFQGAALSPVVRLHRGFNLIGVPRRGAITRVSDLFALSPAVRYVIRHADGKFVVVVSAATDAEAVAGSGYIVLASGDAELRLDGESWTPDSSLAAAPAALTGTAAAGTPLLVAVGRVAARADGRPMDGLFASVKDVATGLSVGAVVGSTAGSGRFQVTFFDPARRFLPGDVLELTLTDDRGTYGVTVPDRRTLTEEHLRDGVLSFGDILLSPTPRRTALAANYPNPFNPETWIPFDLSEPADVEITIYDLGGRQVRRLDLGHRDAGTYRAANRAAHWDGRNEAGERGASGMYVYELRAGSFVQRRRMVVRK